MRAGGRLHRDGRVDLADEERVRARRMLGEDVAAQPADGAGEKRRAISVEQLDALPEADRRYPTSEVLGHALLPAARG